MKNEYLVCLFKSVDQILNITLFEMNYERLEKERERENNIFSIFSFFENNKSFTKKI